VTFELTGGSEWQGRQMFDDEAAPDHQPRRGKPRLSAVMALAVMLGIVFVLPARAQSDDTQITDVQANAPSSSEPLQSEEERFQLWLAEFRLEALSKGVSPATFDQTMADVRPLPEVLKRDRHQPEFRLTFDRYLERAITDARVERAQSLLAKHGRLLREVERLYGVQPRFLVSFWALESNFGDYTGGFSVIEALATLAFDPRRSDFFKTQLIHAMKILQEGHITPDAMSGSWAGAMGQLQFIPSTFTGYAVDHDNDGKRDIWQSLPDIFASAANFLRAEGWQGNRTWGREVRLPDGFDWDLATLAVTKPLSEWQGLGLRKADGSNLPQVDIEGSVILPAGHRGPAFLVYQNFRSTLNWNRSILYAIAVGHLADRIAGGQGLLTNREFTEQPLRRSEVEELQDKLTRLGYDAGRPDGIVGRQTRAALKGFQRQQGSPADGYPTRDLLEALRQAAR
jgi:membrane-bound lytic murein transglycosylase B